MKKTIRTLLSCLLCAVLLLSLGASALAENGPIQPEDPEGFYYARVELVELNDKGEPVMVNNGEWEEQKTLPLYAGGKVTAQDGAAYDLKTNTLTLTDFNKGNYALRVNLMGDDFTLCVKGDCRLSYIRVDGGGVMQPKWGGSLRITGDGTLTVNANKVSDSGVIFYPQEEDKTQFTVDAGVGLSVYGKKTAIEAYGYTGEFTMTSGGKPVEIKKEAAVRELYVGLPGYSNPWKVNIRLCRNAADPEGIYAMNDWYRDDELVNVTVERFVHVKKHDLYLVDHEWGKENGETGRVEFANVAEANAAGYTWVLDADGNQKWLTVDSMGNYSSTEFVWQDAKGDRYIKDHDYNKDCDVTLTIEPLEELPGQYLFLETTAVDPASLTQVTEARVMEGMYDYSFPGTEFKAQTPEAPVIDRIDVSIPDNVFPFGREITAEEMFELFLDHMVTVNTPGVYLIVREVKETETGCYQTLPLTAAKLFSDKPFAKFDPAHGYELLLTFGNSYDQSAGCVTKFADNVALYVNGKAAGSAAPLAEDKNEMVVKGNVILSAGTFRSLLPGDVDNNGKVESADARLALRASVKLENYAAGTQPYLAADVDRNGKIESSDARSILRASVNLEKLT